MSSGAFPAACCLHIVFDSRCKRKIEQSLEPFLASRLNSWLGFHVLGARSLSKHAITSVSTLSLSNFTRVSGCATASLSSSSLPTPRVPTLVSKGTGSLRPCNETETTRAVQAETAIHRPAHLSQQLKALVGWRNRGIQGSCDFKALLKPFAENNEINILRVGSKTDPLNAKGRFAIWPIGLCVSGHLAWGGPWNQRRRRYGREARRQPWWGLRRSSLL